MLRRGFTLVEVTVTIAVLAIILAIALPNLMKMMMVANEEAVVEAMRAVALACDSYQSNTGMGYPDTLAQLLGANPPYLDARFAPITRRTPWRGYQWVYVSPQGGVAVATVGGVLAYPSRDALTLRADPVQRGVTGQRSFFMDQSGTVRVNTRGVAGPNDPVAD